MTLDQAVLHHSYHICAVGGEAADQQRLYTLGFTEGATVRCVLRAPGGDPLAFRVQGAVIALRKRRLQTIMVDREA